MHGIRLTLIPSFFRSDNPSRAGSWEPTKVAILREEAVKFVQEYLGGLSLVLVLHLDEATPLVQGVMVPLLPKREGGMRLCAKDFFDPDRLRYLQQAWEDWLTPHGVGPRTQMSKVEHVDLKTYYSTVHQIQVLDLSIDLRPSDPPKPEPAESEKDYRYRLESWKSGEQACLRERLTPLWAAAIYGKVSARANRRADQLQSRLNKSNANLEGALTMIKAYAPPSGAELEEMLGLSLNDGEVALDGVMRLSQLGRADAIRLIAQRIGPEQAAYAVRGKTLKALFVAKPMPPIRMSFELIEASVASDAQGVVEPSLPSPDNNVEDDSLSLRL